MRQPEAIIFDCDGTLVDSEPIACALLAKCFGELGLAISSEESIERFSGRQLAPCIVELEQELGQPAPDGFVADFRHRMAQAFRRELHAFEGVPTVLQELKGPYCVASNGPREKIDLSLEITDLHKYFSDRIFSSYEVGSWKPEPGLFLHAAEQLGVNPMDCLVVEDSCSGIDAALAAGMEVLAFTSHGNRPCGYQGVPYFNHYREFFQVLGR